MPEPAAPAATPAAPSAGGGATPPNPATPAAPAAAPAAPAAPATPAEDPLKALTEDQWKAIYGSGRFKELNEKAKLADTLQKKQDEAERKSLEEQGKWQELAQKNADQATQYKSVALNSKVEAVAAKLGSVDPEAVAALLDKSNITIDDSLNVTGVEAAVNALKESKPYLFNSSPNQTPRIGSPANPGATNTGFKYKMSEIRNPKFYRDNAVAIKAAIAAGQVDKDS